MVNRSPTAAHEGQCAEVEDESHVSGFRKLPQGGKDGDGVECESTVGGLTNGVRNLTIGATSDAHL